MAQPQDPVPGPAPEPDAPGPPPLRADFTPQSPRYVPRQPGPPDPALFASDALTGRGLRHPHRRDAPAPTSSRPDLFGAAALAVATLALVAAVVTAVVVGR